MAPPTAVVIEINLRHVVFGSTFSNTQPLHQRSNAYGYWMLGVSLPMVSWVYTYLCRCPITSTRIVLVPFAMCVC